MRVLSIDTSTETASVAILEENKLLCEININHKLQHSVILMEEIDRALTYLKMTIDDIDGFVLSKGPGSFTGLRIGAAVIKGLSQGSGKPFISVSSLESLINNISNPDGIVVSIIDALRDNVYAKMKGSDIMLLSIYELEDMVKRYDKVIFVGDGAIKYRDRLEKLQNAHFVSPSLNICRASSLGEIGISLLHKKLFEDIHTFTPLYINKSYVEKQLSKREI